MDVQGFSDDAQGVRVQADGQSLAARELVLATGPWSRHWARQLDLRVPIQPGKGYSLTWSRPALVPQRPVVLKDHSVFVIAWREALRLGGTMEFAGADPSLRATRLRALQQAADHYLRAPRGAQLQEQWCGWRPMSVDDVPVVLELIREIKNDPTKTILLVEHKMDVVRELADRIVVLHNGQLMADGDPATVIASPIVQQAYLGMSPTEPPA
ncbi:hypothetical protein G6F40_013961 [Rhizopus arrhizus]|nr:hypothetical protein G6F40_013961 [Rhizopus arrhizus]